MRAAIYARFSSDLQDNRSITDQVAMAQKYADTRGLKQIAIYEDAAISGASVINRPGLQRLMNDAAAGRVQVLITESLDRLSRNQADIAALYQRLDFLGVRLETLADGLVNEMHVGLKGTMSALFLKDLAQKTRRGQMGRVKAGRIPGGKSYGYDVIPSVDDRGRRVINEKEAAIVRRIYAEYVFGKGTMGIVRALNQEGEPGPSGGKWNLSALIGSNQRRNGLLNNELYNGVIVYNRQRFIKDPTTGKRVSRANPESEWQRQDVPDMRIVDEDIWHKAQQVRAVRGVPLQKIHTQRGPKRLLSGLVHCGCCGAKYNIATQHFMRCSARTNSGLCMDSRLMRVDSLEQRVLSGLEQQLFTDEMFELAVASYKQEFVRAQGDRGADRARKQSELADVQKKSDRLLRLVEDGHADPAVAGPRLNELAARKREITAELAVRPDDAPTIPPGDGAASFRKLVQNLRLGVAEEDERVATALVRGVVRRVTIKSGEDDEPQGVEIEAGNLGFTTPADKYCNIGCGGMQRTISDGSWPSSFFNKIASVPSTSIASG
jgi:site-specific DNA recombinase